MQNKVLKTYPRVRVMYERQQGIADLWVFENTSKIEARKTVIASFPGVRIIRVIGRQTKNQNFG